MNHTRAGRMRAATGTLAGAALLMTLVTIASRLVGFARIIAQAAFVGTEGVATALNSANTLPNVLFEVAAGGALAGSVVPLLAGSIARGKAKEASATASAFLGWTLLVLVPLAGIVALAAEPLAGLLRLKDPVLVATAADFLRVFAVQIPMYGIAVVLGAVLQAHKRFFWPALAPLISSVVVIVVYAIYPHVAQSGSDDPAEVGHRALVWLAWGLTAGVVMLAVPLILPVARQGVRIRPTLHFPPGQGRRAAALAFAGIGALVAQQLSMLVTMQSANEFGGDGAFTVYLYSQQVYLLPYAVLAFPIATSAFPRFADHMANGRTEEFRALAAGATRALVVVVGVGVAMVFAAAGPVQAVFDAFAKEPVHGMAGSLQAMAAGLFGYSLILHLSRVLYTIDRQKSAVVVTAAGWLVVSASALLLPWLTGVRGQAGVLVQLGWSVSLGMTVAGVGLLVAVRVYVGLDALRGVLRTLVVAVLAASAAGWIGDQVSDRLLASGASVVGALGVGFLSAGVSALVVVAFFLLGDRRTILVVVKRRRTGGR